MDIWSKFDAPTELAGEVLDELPGDPAGPGATRDRPFHGLGMQGIGSNGQIQGARIAIDDGKEGVLIAVMEADPQPEPIGERDLFLNRLGWIDRRRSLVLDHVPRHEMAAIGSRIEDDIGWPAFDAAFQDG